MKKTVLLIIAILCSLSVDISAEPTVGKGHSDDWGDFYKVADNTGTMSMDVYYLPVQEKCYYNLTMNGIETSDYVLSYGFTPFDDILYVCKLSNGETLKFEGSIDTKGGKVTITFSTEDAIYSSVNEGIANEELDVDELTKYVNSHLSNYDIETLDICDGNDGQVISSYDLSAKSIKTAECLNGIFKALTATIGNNPLYSF